MEVRRLGSTGLKISRLGLGCGNFGGIGSAPAFYGMGESEAQAFDLMDRAVDAGINFLDTIVREGKVLYVGASNIEAWRLARALWISDARGLARFEWVQNSYSLLDRAAEQEMFPLCADREVGFTAFSPLAGGWLTGKYRSADAYPPGSRMTLRPEPYQHLANDAVFRGLTALSDEARGRGVEMSALALAWVLHHPRVDAAIIGPRNTAHLDAALAGPGIELSQADRTRLASFFSALSLTSS